MSFPIESLMVMFTSPLLSATLFDRVPFGSSIKCLCVVKLGKFEFITYDTTLYQQCIRPILIVLDLHVNWFYVQMSLVLRHVNNMQLHRLD